MPFVNKTFFTGSWRGITCVKYDPLTCDPTLCLPKIAQKAQSVIAFFPERREEIEPRMRGDRTMTLTYLDSKMVKVSPIYIFFRFRLSSGGNRRSKLQKCKLWLRHFSIKARILQKIFKFSRLPLVKIIPEWAENSSSWLRF